MQHESPPTSGYDHACSATPVQRLGRHKTTAAMATLRNHADDALQQAGRHDTTEATRRASRYIDRPFTILGLAS